MSRQFVAGQREEVGGLAHRVVAGNKGPGDLRLEVWVPAPGTEGHWRGVEMRIAGMHHAFFIENEDLLYPPPRFLGGDYWRAWLRLCEENWREADKKLVKEKAWADRKRRRVA